MTFEQKQKKLLKELLDYASALMGSRGCNDLDPALLEDWTEEEKELFREQTYDEEFGDMEDYHPLNYDWWAFDVLLKKFLGDD